MDSSQHLIARINLNSLINRFIIYSKKQKDKDKKDELLTNLTELEYVRDTLDLYESENKQLSRLMHDYFTANMKIRAENERLKEKMKELNKLL